MPDHKGVNAGQTRLRVSSDVLRDTNFDEVACGTPWASVDAAKGILVGATCNTATEHSGIARRYVESQTY